MTQAALVWPQEMLHRDHQGVSAFNWEEVKEKVDLLLLLQESRGTLRVVLYP
jgi:hypothetical protein